MNLLKIAILGAGMIVKDFMTMIDDIPEIKLKAIFGAASDLETMKKMQVEHHIHSVYTDIDLCLADSEVDTVYVALPNFLHFKFAKLALEAGKNVICEKPFTLSSAELLKLKQIAIAKQLILIEAITNQYLTNYAEIKADLASLGTLKVIECNYSQYSSRFDAFRAGKIMPAFDPKKGGGALMDLNIYNIHFVVGLLGVPQTVHYYANVSNGIDTSGVLVLDYPDTEVVCIGAKDSTAPIRSTIEGIDGSIIVHGPTNVVSDFDINHYGTPIQHVDDKIHSHRMFEEFTSFNKIIEQHDFSETSKRMDHSVAVMSIVDRALADANIYLG